MKKVILLAVLLTGSVVPFHAQSLKDAIRLSDNEQYEKAAATLVRLIQQAPNNGENYFYLGENYFRQEELDSALLFYNKGASVNPNFPLNHAGIGKVFWYKGKSAEAGTHFFKAVSIVENDKTQKLHQVNTYLKIAEAYVYAPIKDVPKALSYLNKALAINPKNMESLVLNGDALFEQNTTDGSAAIEEYKKAAAADKTSPKPLVRRGILYMRANNPSEAAKYFTDAITLEPNFAPAYRERAEAYNKMGQIEKALEDYKKYLELNTGSISARVRYGIFLYIAKKYTEALDVLKAVQKEVPSNMVVLRLIGYCYYEIGDMANGMSTMETYLAKQTPDRVIARDYDYYGKFYQKSGKDSLAAEMFKKAFAIDSNNCDMAAEIGGVYAKMKKHADAAVWYQKRILCGKKIVANDYYYLGRSLYYSKQYVYGDSAFAGYIRLQSGIPFGYVWRGRCNAAQDTGKVMKGLALPFYTKVIELVKPEEVEKNKKDLEEAYDYLGSYYLSNKEYAYAKCCYEKIIALNTGSEKFKRVQEFLKSGAEFKGVTAAPDCLKK
ncbi:MAG: tetratricopeptide repeat protein [Bacteroidia bacterium]|nr:tetratricopeptide repeat protein [Bacteroidia bacterium]